MPTQADTIRDEVRTWLGQNWDPELPSVEWRGILADSGWGCPTWPKEWFGRGLDRELASVVAEEFAVAGAVGPATGAGMGLAAPTILDHGSDDLKSRFLRRIITGEDTWCQLFSEPGNGSDLAGMVARAVDAGDEWIVNGQKVWNTGARTAAYGMLVARTDWDVPKHRGITYFVVPMRQPGVDVRPLKQMNGHASFNEVFLTDARIPKADVIGSVNDGWRVALTTLAYERAASQFGGVGTLSGSGRASREAAAEAAKYMETYKWYPQRQGRPEILIQQAKAAGRNNDKVIRQDLARVWTLVKINQWNQQRARAARISGKAPGPEGSLAKLSISEIARQASVLHAAIHGAAGMLGAGDAPIGGLLAEITLSYRAQSIAGGTDEIQRNIIGERVLGLSKDPTVDADIPFREVRTNAQLRPAGANR